VQSAVVVGLRLSEAELGFEAVRKQTRPGAQGQGKDEQVQFIDQAVSERGHDLPLWSDKARSVSIYEGKRDVEPGPGPKGGPL